MLDLGIVIVNWNVRELLAACLDSVYADLAGSGLRGRVVVVDNDSHDGSVEMLTRQFPRTQVLRAPNRGMGAGNNLGLHALGLGIGADSSQAPFAALVLNPDTLVRAGALRILVDFLRQRPAAGVVAPQLLNADGSLQHTGFRFPGLTQAAFDLFPPPGRLARLIESPLNGRYPAGAYKGGPFQVDHTLGAAFAVRGSVLRDQDLFDEIFPMYCEEIDAHWRLRRQGWEVWVAPAAAIVHLGGRSTQQAPNRSFVQLWSSRRRLYQRYHGPLMVAATRVLVELALRGRIRANHRLSTQGQLSPDDRAARNAALAEAMRAWQGRRPQPPAEWPNAGSGD